MEIDRGKIKLGGVRGTNEKRRAKGGGEKATVGESSEAVRGR